MRGKVDQILKILETTNIEIVSYGLAPNPNGFCFEYDETQDSLKECKMLSDLLDSLTPSEEEVLRFLIF